MGIEFPASVKCDKCPKRTTFRVVITKLKPNVEQHFKMTQGWTTTTLPESGEMLVTCPDCNPMLVSMMPPPSAQAEELGELDIVGDPATDPTMSTEVRGAKK